MSGSNPIVTLTMNPSLDVSAEVDRMVPDIKMRCSHVRREPGGGGINVSRVIGILGGRSTAIFATGGCTGKTIDEMLRRQDIFSHPVRTEAPGRESFSLRDLETERQYRYVLPGPELRENEWRQCLEVAADPGRDPEYLVASGSLPPGVPEDFYARLAHSFSGRGTRVVVDTSGAPLAGAMGSGIFLAKPNRRELEELCGCSLVREKDQEKVCRDMVDRGDCEVLVLTLGKEGALLTTADEQVRVRGLDVRAVSSVGAGDSFVGAMVFRLHRTGRVHEAFLYGVAAGTAALLTKGTELCRKNDVESIFRQLQ